MFYLQAEILGMKKFLLSFPLVFLRIKRSYITYISAASEPMTIAQPNGSML